MMEQIEHFAQTHPGMSLAALIVRPSHGGSCPALRRKCSALRSNQVCVRRDYQDYVAELARLDGNHFMCDYEDFKVGCVRAPRLSAGARPSSPADACCRIRVGGVVQVVANLLQGVPGLTLRERFTFCMAPVQIQSDFACRMLYDVRGVRAVAWAGALDGTKLTSRAAV